MLAIIRLIVISEMEKDMSAKEKILERRSSIRGMSIPYTTRLNTHLRMSEYIASHSTLKVFLMIEEQFIPA